MTELLWFLTRASGIVAMVLIAAAVIDGLIFSGREGGRRLRPAWWLDLHRGLGGYALIFTGFHLLTAYGADLGYRIIDIVIPGISKTSTVAMTLGVLSFYAISITVFTTWPKRLFGRRLWHIIHLFSLPAAVAVAVHGWQMGTDATSGWYVTLMAVLTALVTYPAGLRITGLVRKRKSDRKLAASSNPPSPSEGPTGYPLSPPTASSAERVLADATR